MREKEPTFTVHDIGITKLTPEEMAWLEKRGKESGLGDNSLILIFSDAVTLQLGHDIVERSYNIQKGIISSFAERSGRQPLEVAAEIRDVFLAPRH
jgi:hypothetical protein